MNSFLSSPLFKSVTCVLVEEQPWYLANDLLKALAMDPKMLSVVRDRDLVRDDDGDFFVNEAGAYDLILEGPDAVRMAFRDWICAVGA